MGVGLGAEVARSFRCDAVDGLDAGLGDCCGFRSRGDCDERLEGLEP